jgi:hypothetical protein
MAELTIHDPQFTLLTVTWSRDKPHFSLLRQSLAQSRFAHIPHHVVVHHEDLALFREFPTLFCTPLPTFCRQRSNSDAVRPWSGNRAWAVAALW